MDRSLLKSKLWIMVTGMLLLSAFNAPAQCVVGGTDFDTGAILFDPEMTNDATATGWYNEDVGDVLADLCISCQYYSQVENGIHKGVLSNAMSSGGALFSEALWTTILTNGNNVPNTFIGGSAIVANPKLIDPRLKEFHNNMFVNAGATHEKPFFSYTATGLAPNTPVTITLDVYNLLDLESAEEYSKANGGVDFAIGGYNYDAAQKQYYGNTNVSISGSTALNNGAVYGGTSTGTIPFGGSKTLEISATTDDGGTVTFYFGRPGGINFAPIGIDNIEVKGTLKPKVVSQKVLPVCVGNPVILRSSSSYPAGTTFSWTTTPNLGSSTAQQFAVIPSDVQDYTVKLTVTIPGCAAASSDNFTLTVKQCCTGPGNVPMAETYIFYDDFGEFAGANSYQYRAADGSLQDGSVAGIFQFNENPPVATKPPGFTSAYTYWSDSPNQHERALIIPWFPYTSPRFYDNTTGNGTNGMLFFGLGSAGNMNKVLYQRKICGLCPGKEIKFGASYSAANTNAGGVFEVELRLMEGDYESSLGAQLASSGTQVLTRPEWKGFETTFTVTDPSMDCVTLQVVSKKDDYNGMNIGDLALDDIYASVCTPPDVSVSASLSGSAPDILNLCSGTSFSLQAETSTAITTFYESNPAYLFQFSFDNPSTTENPTWYDLGTIGTTTSYTIADPKNHPAFNYESGPGVGKNKTYFRIVVGEQSYLSSSRAIWENMDALSPCRAVSISSIPVEASVNCPCLTPNTVKIAADKPIAGKTMTLCMDETATLSLEQGASPDYEIQWFKQNTQPVPADIPLAKTPTYAVTATEVGTTIYWVKVIETLEDREDCRRFDKITIQVNVPAAENVDGEVACVADEKNPAGSDNICFKFESNYAKGTYTGTSVDSEFGIYQRLTGTAVAGAGTIEVPANESVSSICVPGNQVEVETVGADTYYHVYLEDKTVQKGTLYKGALAGVSISSNQRFAMCIEATQAVELTSLKIYVRSNGGSKSLGVTPILYGTRENSGQTVPALTGTNITAEQSFTYDNQITEITVDLDNYSLAEGKYYIGFAFSGGLDNIYYISPAATGTMYNTPYVDDLQPGGAALYGIGSTENDNPAGRLSISDLKFNLSVPSQCERTKLTTKYYCPPCELPTLVSGKYITITPSQAAVDDTVRLCKESPALQLTSDITKTTGNFDILWYDDKNGTAIQTDLQVTTSTRADIAWGDIPPGTSKTYYVKVRDNNKPTSTACWQWDSILVKSNPVPSVNHVPDQAVCSNAATTAVTLSSTPAGAAYSWTATPLGVTGLVNTTGTTGTIASESALKVSGTIAGTVTYTITPTLGGCVGPDSTFVITVKPLPAITNTDLTDTICSASSIPVVLTTDITSKYLFTSSAGTVTGGSITGNTAGDGVTEVASLPADVLTNSGTTAGKVTYKITPVADQCKGAETDYVVTVNPKPVITLKAATAAKCQDEAMEDIVYELSGGATGATIGWGEPLYTGTTPPAGVEAKLSADKKSFIISGTPQVSGTFKFKITTSTEDAADPCPAAGIEGEVVVNALPDNMTDRLIEWQKGKAPDPQSPSDSVKAEAGNSLVWYDDTKTILPGSGAAPSISKDAVKVLEYYVKQKNANGCESKDFAKITISIFDVPLPKVENAYYCKGEANPADLTDLVEANANHTLTWYASKNDPKGSGSPDPVASIDTSIPGEYEFYVSQIDNATNGESEKATILVTVYGVLNPDVSKNTLSYCNSSTETASELKVEGVTDNLNNFYRFDTDGFVWYSEGTEVGAKPSPVNLNVSTTTEYNFGVKATYTITENNPSTTCESGISEFTVTVNVAPVPTSETNFEVRYKRKDLLANPNTNLLQQDEEGTVALIENGCGTCTLEWSTDGTNFTSTVPTPVPSAGFEGKNETQDHYWVRQFDGKCYSAPERITVYINDAPSPRVTNISYCEGGNGQVDAVKAEPETSFGGGPFDLQWYSDVNLTTKIGGLNDDLPASVINTTVPGGTSKVLEFYVTQTDRNTLVESEPTKLTVTVYANPVLSIVDPAVPCEDVVNINQQDIVWFLDNTVAAPVSAKFYNNATDDVTQPGTASYTPSLVAKSGTYYMGLEFKNPGKPANTLNEYCFSQTVSSNDKTPKAINVLIDSLSIENLIVPATTCPGTPVPVTAEVKANNGNTVTYSWTGEKVTGSGGFEGFNGASNLATVNTQNLSTVEDDQYTFTVTVEAGACKGAVNKSKTKTSEKLTIGSGPVIGKMTVTDDADIHTGTPANELEFIGDNNKNPFEFWSCGGNITIAAQYEPSDLSFPLSNFVWYEGSTQVGTGETLQITGMTEKADRTFRLEYVNKCPAFVSVTIKSRPLSVENDLTAADMGFCQDNEFNAELEISGYETGITTVEWKKDGMVPPYPANGNTYTIPSAKPSDDGVYSYTVTSRGCVIEREIAGGTPLKVDPRPSFEWLPVAELCEGDTVEIALKAVYPGVNADANGTTLTWNDPDGTIIGTNTGLSVLATPPFSGTDVNDFRKTYTYTVNAKYGYCTHKAEVEVYVDKPLSGMLVGDTVCQGVRQAKVDASNYQATSYIWTDDTGSQVGSGAIAATLMPEATTMYRVDMMRGTCVKNDSVEVIVNSNPVIIRIDSLDVRVRQIIVDENTGTYPYFYAVNSQKDIDFTADDIKYNLSFGKHNIYVKDVNGCKGDSIGYVMDPPEIFIPGFFSPGNKDGVNDTWNVGNLREVYPDALVTIYDRFGKQLIQYRGEADGWDGTYLGKEMPTTDYWYVIEIKEINKQYVGHFTLLRR